MRSSQTLTTLFTIALLASALVSSQGEVSQDEDVLAENFAALESVPQTAKLSTDASTDDAVQAPDWPTPEADSEEIATPKAPVADFEELTAADDEEMNSFQCAPGGEVSKGMCSHMVRKGMKPKFAPGHDIDATNKPLKTELISAIPQKDGTSVNVALAPADAPDNIPDYGKEPPMQFQEYKDGEMEPQALRRCAQCTLSPTASIRYLLQRSKVALRPRFWSSTPRQLAALTCLQWPSRPQRRSTCVLVSTLSR